MSGDHSESKGVSRRNAIAGIVGGGLGALAPAGAAAATRPEASGARQSADGATAGGEWPPPFLSEHQRETLEALAERILPGSREAGVARFVDRLLGVSSPGERSGFLAALSAFDAESLGRWRRPFVRLDRDEQAAILDDAAREERESLQRPVDWGWFDVPAEAELPASLGARLFHLKAWIGRAYYSSERGARELGWTGVPIHDGFPGCTHGGHG